MACPQPVVSTKQVMDRLKENALTIIVDNPASSQEVERFARSQGCSVRIEKKGKDFYVHIQIASQCEIVRKVVIYIISNLLGVGDEAVIVSYSVRF